MTKPEVLPINIGDPDKDLVKNQIYEISDKINQGAIILDIETRNERLGNGKTVQQVQVTIINEYKEDDYPEDNFVEHLID